MPQFGTYLTIVIYDLKSFTVHATGGINKDPYSLARLSLPLPCMFDKLRKRLIRWVTFVIVSLAERLPGLLWQPGVSIRIPHSLARWSLPPPKYVFKKWYLCDKLKHLTNSYIRVWLYLILFLLQNDCPVSFYNQGLSIRIPTVWPGEVYHPLSRFSKIIWVWQTQKFDKFIGLPLLLSLSQNA
jgi:hypothetical protein